MGASIPSGDEDQISFDFNSDPSGKCGTDIDTVSGFMVIGGGFADWFTPSGQLVESTSYANGNTVGMQFGGPAEAGGDYACVTAAAFTSTGPSSTQTTSTLTPALYFTGYGPVPTCQTASATTSEGAQTSVTLSCAATYGGTPSYAIAAGPTHGTLGSINQATGQVTYTPNPGFSGSDSFTYTGANSYGASTATTVAITVTAPTTATKCVVPALIHKTLARARTALHRAHCALGRVTEPKHHHGTLHVRSQKPRAGSKLAAGAKVAVTLK